MMPVTLFSLVLMTTPAATSEPSSSSWSSWSSSSSSSSSSPTDADRGSWSSSAGIVARPLPPGAKPGPGFAPVITGIATAIGSVAGYAAGLAYGDRQGPPDPSSVLSLALWAPGCCGLAAGSSVGALAGASIGYVVDGDLDPIAIPAAAFAAPAAVVAGWGALLYPTVLLAPTDYLVEDGPLDVRSGNPIAYLGVVSGTGFSTALATFAVSSLRYREPGTSVLPPAPLPTSSAVPAPSSSSSSSSDPAEPANEDGASQPGPQTPSSLPSSAPSAPIIE